MMQNNGVSSIINSIGKVIPGQGAGIMGSIDNAGMNGYGSQTSNFSSVQQGQHRGNFSVHQRAGSNGGMSQGPLSNAGSFYSNMGGIP